MTREQKLALIVGFALVLVVGVLISDQLSVARRPVDSVGGGLAMSLEPASTDAYPGFGRPLEPQPAPTTTRRFPIESATQVVMETPGLEPVPDPVPGETSTNFADAAMRGLSNGFDTMGTILRDAQDNGIPAYQAAPIEMGVPVTGTVSTVPQSRVQQPEATPKESVRAVKTHRVVEGDTLWSIAKKHYGDGSAAEALAKYNEKRIGKGGMIREGASLLIPDRAELGLGGARTAEAKPETKPATKPETKSEAKPAAKTAEKPKADAAKTYTVKSGDTLQKISQKLYGTTKRWTVLAELNSDVIDDEDNVRVGTVLKLPSR